MTFPNKQNSSLEFELQPIEGSYKSCPYCQSAMNSVTLAGHYGKWVTVEVCEPCHLLWFERFESVNLAAPGVLQLVRTVVSSHTREHSAVFPGTALKCPECSNGLKLVRDKTRYGETVQFRCTLGHGSAQTFTQYLTEKGLVRPLSRAELVTLMKRSEHDAPRLSCINCGAAHKPTNSLDSTCAYCESPYVALDMAGLLRVIDPYETAHENEAAKALKLLPAERKQIACPHCGVSLDATRNVHCPSCQQTVVVTDMRYSLGLLEALSPLIEAHHRHMPPKESDARLTQIYGDATKARDEVFREQAHTHLHWSGQPLSFVAHVGVLIAAVAVAIILWLVRYGI